ncbi:MAG TPA: hypothetical protein VF189_00545, partial [Patescibacteria group bacterium]
VALPYNKVMPKRKVKFAEDPEEEEEVEEVWDFKKIAIGIIVIILLIFGGIVAKRVLMHESLDPMSFLPQFPSVKGISTYFSPQSGSHTKISLPSQADVQNQIQEIQQQVTHLNVNDIATASPQVKNLIKQIQDLPSGPVGQVKEACMRLCNSF